MGTFVRKSGQANTKEHFLDDIFFKYKKLSQQKSCILYSLSIFVTSFWLREANIPTPNVATSTPETDTPSVMVEPCWF